MLLGFIWLLVGFRDKWLFPLYLVESSVLLTPSVVAESAMVVCDLCCGKN